MDREQIIAQQVLESLHQLRLGLLQRLEQERLALSTAQRDLEIMDLENQGKQAKLARDPDLHVRTQLAQLDGELGKLDAELKARLADSYPHDQATGYSKGQIRGALTVKRPL